MGFRHENGSISIMVGGNKEDGMARIKDRGNEAKDEAVRDMSGKPLIKMTVEELDKVFDELFQELREEIKVGEVKE